MPTNETTPRRRSRNPLAPLFADSVTAGTVTDTELVTPTMKWIRIQADRRLPKPYVPGQHIRIEIRDPLSWYGLLRPEETLRTYTIRHYSADDQVLDVLAHLYDGDGIGLAWARAARAGDPVRFWGPQGDFGVRSAPYHLFVGEETGACAFEPMVAALDPSTPVYAVLESESPDDDVPVPALRERPHAVVRRVHRRGASAVESTALLDALAELELPSAPGAAYVAGEAKTGQLIRRHLMTERGWPRSAVRVKPFWTPGKRGLHH